MCYTFLKSSIQTLFRTVFRFEKFQLEVFFLNFQSSKISEILASFLSNHIFFTFTLYILCNLQRYLYILYIKRKLFSCSFQICKNYSYILILSIFNYFSKKRDCRSFWLKSSSSFSFENDPSKKIFLFRKEVFLMYFIQNIL